jgi:hypothetical protein
LGTPSTWAATGSQPAQSGVEEPIVSHRSTSHSERSRANSRSDPTLPTAPLSGLPGRTAIVPDASRRGADPPQRVPLPQQGPGSGLVAGAAAAGGGGVLLFGLLSFLLLLAIPNAVRWLRPAVALGLSPAYVALRDRPG